MSRNKIDWVSIKAEYMAGAEPRELVKKFKVSKKTLGSRISRDGWYEKRKTARESVFAKAMDSYSDTLANKQVLSMERYSDYYASLSEHLMDQIPAVENNEKLSLIKALFICQTGEFRCLGINEESHQNLIIKSEKIKKDNDPLVRSVKTESIKMILGNAGVKDTLLNNDFKISGSRVGLIRFFSLSDKAPGAFGIVTP